MHEDQHHRRAIYRGSWELDAFACKASFGISEGIVLQQVRWLKQRQGWTAMLPKSPVTWLAESALEKATAADPRCAPPSAKGGSGPSLSD